MLAAGIATMAACASKGEEKRDALFDEPPGIPYSVELRGAPDDDLSGLLEDALKIYTLADRQPSSLARLRRRAEGDIPLAESALRAAGYLEGKAGFQIVLDERKSEALTDATAGSSEETPEQGEGAGEQAEPAGPPAQLIVFTLDPGQLYTLAAFEPEIVGASGLPAVPLEDIGPPIGEAARADGIVAAEDRILEWLEASGYPHARFEGRRLRATRAGSTLRVTSRYTAGPRVSLGEAQYDGLTRVEQTYLETYRNWEPGDTGAPGTVIAFQDRLYGTGLFDSVSATLPAWEGDRSQPSEITQPVQVSAVEAKHRTVGGGLRYSTQAGPGVRAFLEHRNLFGANETGRVEFDVALDEQEAGVQFSKPQFLQSGQTLRTGATVRAEQDEAFDETAFRAYALLERKLSRRLTVSGGVSLEWSRIDENDQPGTSRLVGLPLRADYDASNDRLDPVEGYRIGAGLTPYTGTFRDETLAFAVTDIQGSIYWPLDDAKHYVLAARTRLATLVGAARDDVPAPKRIYSGGGGSVRPYQHRFIGPLDADEDPVGGRSGAELGVELRWRLNESVAVVPFLEAGTISESLFPDFDSGVQYGGGLGVRYYTPVGPLRADFAFPFNKRDADDAFQFYVSIGQAF